MVLEVFTALGLASSIVQFVDYGTKLFSKSKEIYHSATGASSENFDLQVVSLTLQDLSNDLANTSYLALGPWSRDEKALAALAHECNKAASELVSLLKTLQNRKGNTKFKSFRQALLVMWKENRVAEMSKKMNRFRDQVALCLTKVMLDRQSSVVSMLQDLSDANIRLESKTSNKLESLRLDVLDVLDQLRLQKERRDQDQRAATALPKREEREAYFEKIDIRMDGAASELAPVLISKLATWIEDGRRIATEQHILASLCFRSMRVRHSQIAEAHTKTFDWMFVSRSSSVDPRARFKFIDWLQADNGIYWVSGKPGSGKSTLLKLLCDSPRTREALTIWAQGKELLTASFFFWNAGTELQKSQEGLLQSLLYEIMRQCPALIPVIAPSRWSARGAAHLGSLDPWSRVELKSTFERLKEQRVIPARFCFFIDGLDEFDGDHIDIINIVRDLAECPDIKICLSSRPWNVFQAAFGDDRERTLLLEELTQDDIKFYVQSKLEGNALFLLLREKDPRYQNLVQEIVEKAKGVFLWVFLVVRSLLKGITNSDRISELQMRLRLLPGDLEKYFQHILDSTDEVYRESAAQTFRIALEADEPLSLFTYSFLDELAPDYAIQAPVRALSAPEILLRFRDIRKRLNARCNGLLEVTTFENIRANDGDDEEFTQNLHVWDDAKFLKKLGTFQSDDDLFLTYRVDFLHRTVRDFLRTKDIQNLLMDRTGSDFRPNVHLCLAFLGQIKALSLTESFLASGPFSDLVEDLIFYARQEELSSEEPQTRTLDEFSRVIHPYLHFPDLALRKLNRAEQAVRARRGIVQTLTKDPFLGFMVQNGLCLYVKQKLDQTLWNSLIDTSLVDFALRPCVSVKHPQQGYSPEMVRLLLSREQIREKWVQEQCLGCPRRPWGEFLSCVLACWAAASEKARKAEVEIMQLLLRTGSNPNERSPNGVLWASLLFEMIYVCVDGDDDSKRITSNWTICQVAEVFLTHGANPNEMYKILPQPSTVWSMFLRQAICKNGALHDQQLRLHLVEQFLRHGADLKCRDIRVEDRNFSVVEAMQLILPPEEFARLKGQFFVARNRRFAPLRNKLRRRR